MSSPTGAADTDHRYMEYYGIIPGIDDDYYMIIYLSKL